MAAVSFEAGSKTLFFDSQHFSSKQSGAFWSWAADMKFNRRVSAQTIIGQVFWEDGTIEPVAAGVAGVILRTNRRIDHARLRRRPPQFAIVFK